MESLPYTYSHQHRSRPYQEILQLFRGANHSRMSFNHVPLTGWDGNSSRAIDVKRWRRNTMGGKVVVYNGSSRSDDVGQLNDS